jgi:hypothetical protein
VRVRELRYAGRILAVGFGRIDGRFRRAGRRCRIVDGGAGAGDSGGATGTGGAIVSGSGGSVNGTGGHASGGIGSGGANTGGVAATGGHGSGGSGSGGSGSGGATPAGGRGSGGAIAASGGSGTAGAVSASGGSGSGGMGTGGSVVASGGSPGTGGAVVVQPQIISIDFVGGRGGVGGATPTAMGPTEIAGVKPASHWNSISGPSGTQASLMFGGGTASTASITWAAPISSGNAGMWSVNYLDIAGDARMMNGYLDAAWATVPTGTPLPTIATISGLPAAIASGGYDVYVYVYGGVPASETRSCQYAIGASTFSVQQTGPTSTTPPAPFVYMLAPNMGAGHYIVFRGVTGASFTLTAAPIAATASRFRAPVNGLQIVYPTGS